MRLGIAFLVLVLAWAPARAAEEAPPPAHAESSRLAYAFLRNLCDDFGGRLTGGAANRGAMQALAAELASLGLKPEFQTFSMPGWERGVDSVALVEPFARPLRVASLAYTNPTAPFEAEVVDVAGGRSEDYPSGSQGKVALLAPSSALHIHEIVKNGKDRGVRAILYINREAGGQLLARTGSFQGGALPFPLLSITQEEGFWLQRLLARKVSVKVKIETTSRCREIETANLRVRIPGRSSDTVIVGAHFDSWDLGQGAMDNGLGIAQLLALAHLMRDRDLLRTVELIWFNGEEQGLWGSRHAARQLDNAPIVAMINLDMVGVPIAVNALGDESSVPALERFHNGRKERLPLGVQNVNWFGSDHTPYQLAGVRAITFNAPIDRASVRYYHDLADTIDKLPEKVVVDSTATIGDLVLALANDPKIEAFRRTSDKTEALFTRFGIDRRVRDAGLWPFR